MTPVDVAYSVSSWLPLTMNWIYTQIKYLEHFTPLVLTDATANLDLLPSYPLVSLEKSPLRPVYAYARKAGLPLAPAAFQEAVREFQPAVLHSHFGDWGWFDLPLVRCFGLKHVVTFYGYDLSLLPVTRPKWKRRYAELFARADRFLCEGPYMAHTLVEMGCPPEKVSVQRLGVDLDQTPFVPRRLNPGEPIRIMIAGRFVEKKGIPDALEAVGQIRGRFPGLRVSIFGDSTGIERDEQEKRKILDVIRRHGMESIIAFHGFQPLAVLMREIYNHHIFLSPSVVASDGDTEGGAPVTIIQALASGMPVVSTTHCDIPGVVTHGQSGYLAAEHDPGALAGYLQTLIEHPETWEAMAAAGRRHIEAEFDCRVQGRRLREVYDRLAGRA